MKKCGLPQGIFITPITKALMGFGGREIPSSKEFFDLVIEYSRGFLSEAEILAELNDPDLTMEDFFAPDSMISGILGKTSTVIGSINNKIVSGKIPEAAMPTNAGAVLGLKLAQHRAELYESFKQKFDVTTEKVVVGKILEDLVEDDILKEESEELIDNKTDVEDDAVMSVVDGYIQKSDTQIGSDMEQEEFQSKLNVLDNEKDLPIHAIAKTFYSETPYLLNKLKTDFKRVFYDNFVNLEGEKAVGVKSSADHIDTVVAAVRTHFEARITDSIKTGQYSMKEILETPELAEAYNGMVAIGNFGTFAKEFMTGIQLDKRRLVESNKDVNTGFTSGGHALTAESQVSEIDKLHFNNTPRLIAKKGSEIPGIPEAQHTKTFYVVDPDNTTISYANVKNMSEILAEFPGNGSMDEYAKAMEIAIRKGVTPNGTELSTINKEILRSIYQRFLAEEAYTVHENGETRVVSSIRRAGLDKPYNDPTNKMINSIFRAIRSAANKEDIQVRNGELIMSKTTISDVGGKVISGYNNTIASALDPTTIDHSIGRNVSFFEPEPEIVIQAINSEGMVIETIDPSEASDTVRRQLRKQQELDNAGKKEFARDEAGVYYTEHNATPYSMIIRVGDAELKIDKEQSNVKAGGKNGRVVTVHADSVNDLKNDLKNDENRILKAFQNLGFSNSLKKGFVRAYNSNIEAITAESNHNDMSLSLIHI